MRGPPVPMLSVDMSDDEEEVRPDAHQIWTTDGTIFFRAATKMSPRHYRSFKARKFLRVRTHILRLRSACLGEGVRAGEERLGLGGW